MEHERVEDPRANGPVAETAQKLKELRRELGEVAESMYDTAGSAPEDIRRNSNRSLERLYDDGRKKVRSLSRQVQDQPIQSVLLAAGAGILTGLLLRRWGGRSSRRQG